MSTILINNTRFDFNSGCKLLKLKYDKCPEQFEDAIGDMWDDIIPMSFKEIAMTLTNVEQRRVGINCLGLERLAKEINPTLVKSESLSKTTTWVTQDGSLKTKKYKDTYELYRVDGKVWSEGVDRSRPENVYYIKCKDTSTDREYFLWVNLDSVRNTNDRNWMDTRSAEEIVNPIQAIAWTIQTDIPLDGIEKIVRQGDCILLKKKQGVERGEVRHLTEKEYRKLLVLES